jgi:hypothetical protein
MIVAQLPYTDNRPFVRFKGKFRDLIPQGWTFKKCFGHNYRCYEKQVTYGQRVEIWVHCGGYVEIDAFGGYSSLFVQFLLDEANVEKVQKAFDAELGERGRRRKSFDFYVNTQKEYLFFTTEFSEKPDAHLRTSALPQDELDVLYDAYYKEWQSFTVRRELFEATLEMMRSGMIEVVTP